MSEIEENTNGEIVPETAAVASSRVGFKKTKIKFVSATTIHNLKREEIYKYIVGLHKRIRKLIKKCRQYKNKVLKLRLKSHRRKDEVEIVDEVEVEQSSAVPEKQTTEAPDANEAASNFIADIKNAAQEAQNNMGFIYEPTSGLYYDSRTGYYYNAEHGLYYDGNNGCYYSYNQEENKFEFHSQVYADGTEPVAKETKSTKQTGDEDGHVKSSKKKKKRKRRSSSNDDSEEDAKRHRRKHRSKQKHSHRRDHDDDIDREDGEISEEDDSSDEPPPEKEKSRSRHSAADEKWQKSATIEILDSTESSMDSEHSFSNGKIQDVAKKYPPSIRIIVQETNVKKLKIGELFMITYKGGSLGREGSHDVILPDINCSKYHLKFTFDENSAEYRCTDLGSRNGTLMNGKRMSNAKQESEAMPLKHGTVLQIGQTRLLCHIHDGHSTCGYCEPGLFPAPTPDTGSNNVEVADGPKLTNAADEHKRQLKNLKKRYGLEDEQYVASRATTVKNDRAAQRRQKVGSSCDFEKTKTASLDTSIPSENKGFKMLAKLGWNEGQSLGKNSDGLLEPIALHSNQGTMGLGCDSQSTLVKSCDNPRQKAKSSIWKKTQDRYKASDAKVNMFDEQTDDSD